MKINPSYTLHTVAGEHIILIQDAKENKVLSLNPTAQFLWENLNGKDFTLEEAVSLLTSHFDVEREKAATDAEKWVHELHELGIIH